MTTAKTKKPEVKIKGKTVYLNGEEFGEIYWTTTPQGARRWFVYGLGANEGRTFCHPNKIMGGYTNGLDFRSYVRSSLKTESLKWDEE